MPEAIWTDPLRRPLALHERTWFGHILRGHPELAQHKATVQKAVTLPEEIRYSNSDPDCRLYIAPAHKAALSIVVVADIVAGVVKTAYLARKPGGGEVEWSKPT